jgi:hypothetical protein
MGTRGAFGFIVNEQEKIAYNHFDSYPEGKGIEVLRWLREADLDDVRRRVADLLVVDPESSPTPEDIERLRQYANMHVGGPASGTPLEQATWYQLLRETQGDLTLILQAGVIEDGHTFPLDSLFCEWAYIVDLDKNRFEVYEGFQRKLPKKGRWKGRPTKAEDEKTYEEHVRYAKDNGREPWRPLRSDYKAVELFADWSLIGLPGDDEFLGLSELRQARRNFDYYVEKGDRQAIVDEIVVKEVEYGQMYEQEWIALKEEALAFAGLAESDSRTT